MSIVAAEMEKAGFQMPLLIGGATTSKLHTALKIEPKYRRGAVVYVKDASQSPGVAANLLNSESKEQYLRQIRDEYAELRENNMDRNVELVPLQEAREKRFRIDWSGFVAEKPRMMGRKVLKQSQWRRSSPSTGSFSSWLEPVGKVRLHCTVWLHAGRAMRGRSVSGRRAGESEGGAKLYDDAVCFGGCNDKADYIRAVCGLYEAYSENDTIVAGGISIPMLRQQKKSEKDEYLCLSDLLHR